MEAINRDLIAKAGSVDSPQRVVVDIDSTESRRPDRISATREAGGDKISEARAERGAVETFGVRAIGAGGNFTGP